MVPMTELIGMVVIVGLWCVGWVTVGFILAVRNR